MQGTRLEDRAFSQHLMRPHSDPAPNGAYGRVQRNGEWTWMAMTPNGHLGDLSAHEVTEHEDGTITVSPSIEVTVPGHPDPEVAKGWHGFLERGVWREC